VIFEHLQADLPDLLSVLLQAGENTESIGNRVVAESARIGCAGASSSGVPLKGFKGCGPGRFFSSAANAAAPKTCIKTIAAQILAYIVSGSIFVHGFTSTAAVPSRSKEESVYAWSLLRRF
jgi:hypothetical protein